MIKTDELNLLTRQWFRLVLFLFLFPVTYSLESADHAVILQYHHISSLTPAATSLNPERFEQQLNALEQGGFVVMALPDLLNKIQSGEPLRDKTVAITFDDGYKSVYEVAYPMLKKRGWPFTVFVVPGVIEKKQAHSMTWQQIAALSEGGVTIANHSYHHEHLIRKLKNETELQWQQRVLEDIKKAELLIEVKTGQHHQLFAWPYGEYTGPLSDILKDSGYRAVAQYSGAIDKESNFLALPRFTFNQFYSDRDDFIIKASSLPLKVKKITPSSPFISGLKKPEIKLLLENSGYKLEQLNCYASGQGKVKSYVSGLEVTIRFNRIPDVGRSRLNCTLPVANKRYRWFSVQLIRKNQDGSWYSEP